MRLIGKLVVIFITIGILLGASAYVIVYTEDNDNNGGGKDTKSPQVDFIKGNVTITAGQSVTITANFSDNVKVTVAMLYYKAVDSSSWESTSILNGSAAIDIPSSTTSNYYYYITIDDAAGNGPIGNPSIDGSKYYVITVKSNNGNGDSTHVVFIEDGTATWCNNCPITSEILDNLYDPAQPTFYYVSMIGDVNNKAAERLSKSYNIYGYPTVFIDGGYGVVLGKQADSVYKDMISSAASREIPRLSLSVSTTWNQSNKEVLTSVHVKNKNTIVYTGYLKVYITEINSRWADWDGKPYHYGFLDYAIDKSIEIEGNSEEIFSSGWKVGTSGYANVYPENLFVIAVVFSSQSTQKFSDPPSNTKSFDAYYADVVKAARVVNGSLPPSVGICWPKANRYCLLGFCNENLHTLRNRTVLFGRTRIRVCPESDLEIERIEIVIQGRFRKIQATLYEGDEWLWRKFACGPYTITVYVYDTEGRVATDSMNVFAFIL